MTPGDIFRIGDCCGLRLLTSPPAPTPQTHFFLSSGSPHPIACSPTRSCHSPGSLLSAVFRFLCEPLTPASPSAVSSLLPSPLRVPAKPLPDPQAGPRPPVPPQCWSHTPALYTVEGRAPSLSGIAFEAAQTCVSGGSGQTLGI